MGSTRILLGLTVLIFQIGAIVFCAFLLYPLFHGNDGGGFGGFVIAVPICVFFALGIIGLPTSFSLLLSTDVQNINIIVGGLLLLSSLLEFTVYPALKITEAISRLI